jgi:hypothetical protein
MGGVPIANNIEAIHKASEPKDKRLNRISESIFNKYITVSLCIIVFCLFFN